MLTKFQKSGFENFENPQSDLMQYVRIKTDKDFILFSSERGLSD